MNFKGILVELIEVKILSQDPYIHRFKASQNRNKKQEQTSTEDPNIQLDQQAKKIQE
jgi:hypothetical protein